MAILAVVVSSWANPVVSGQAIGLPEISTQSKEGMDCHKKINLVIYQQWGSSKHYRANVGCFECHSAESSDPDAVRHYNQTISVVVMAIVLSVLASVYPAWRASRLDPVEALRYE